MEAKISTYLSKQEIKTTIKEPGSVKVAELQVSDRVVATLHGGSSFDISPAGPREQWVSNADPTVWTWDVTPKIAGDNQVLILSFDAIINVNNKDGKRTVNTFTRRINVDVGWPTTVCEWLDLIKKTGENSSWIWASILIPVVGGAWAWIKRRRKPSEVLGSGAAPRSGAFSADE